MIRRLKERIVLRMNTDAQVFSLSLIELPLLPLQTSLAPPIGTVSYSGWCTIVSCGDYAFLLRDDGADRPTDTV